MGDFFCLNMLYRNIQSVCRFGNSNLKTRVYGDCLKKIILTGERLSMLNADYLMVGMILVGSYFMACLILTWAGTRIWCRPKRQAWKKVPEDYNLKSEKVLFFSHGIPINGRLIPVKPFDWGKPAIILVHGWSHNGSRLILLARELHRAGYSILLYDARGHGNSGSDGPITIRKIAQDIISAVNFLEMRSNYHIQPIGLFGHSIGGSASILASAMEPRIRALVSCSAFSDPSKLTKNTLRKMHVSFFPVSQFIFYFLERYLERSVDAVSPEKAIRKVQVPTMLFHGGADRYISPDNLDALFGHSDPDHTKRLLLAGLRHSDLLEDHTFINGVVNFFKTHLPVETVASIRD